MPSRRQRSRTRPHRQSAYQRDGVSPRFPTAGLDALPRAAFPLGALCMEPVWLLLGSGAGDLGPVDPFGFSWPVAVSSRKPPLMRVGFPWISLDSLVRIETYQWVTRKKRRKFFPLAFPSCTSRAGTEPAVLAYGSAGVGHGRKLSQFLLFCKILLALIALSVDKV
jgi:hypothetical protein